MCFELSPFLGQSENVLMWLVSMLYYDSRYSIGIISLLFSGYTISLLGHVFGEQRGGAAEILSRIVVEYGN